jgi:hypothetical protein
LTGFQKRDISHQSLFSPPTNRHRIHNELVARTEAFPMHWLKRWFPKMVSPLKPKYLRSFRPGLETLEDRRVLTPVAPTLLAPNGWSPPTPTFTWSADPNAVYYNFQIYDVGTKALIKGPGLTQTTLNLGAPLTLGDTYQWSVQSVDSAGNLGPWSTFTIGVTNLTKPVSTGPSGPALPQPAFSWAPLTGASHYDIWVQNQNTNQILRNTDVTGTVWSPPTPLAQGSTFIWWVRGVDSNGISGPWSDPLTFSESVLPAPTPNGPSGIAVPQATFGWTPVPSAEHYDVWLQDKNTGLTLRDTNVPATSWTPASPLSAQHSYIWWVRAVDAHGYNGQWSTPQTFTVYTLAASVVLSPAGSSGTLPTFSWNPITGANHYDIWVQNMTTGQVLRNQNIAGTTYVPTSPLTPGDSYQWWVRGVDSVGNPGPWGSAQNFVAYVLAAPSLMNPSGSSTTLPTFSWSAVTGADHYDIWVQDIKTGVILRDTNVPGAAWTPANPLNQGDTYHWWVRAMSKSGLGSAWSPYLSFSVAALAAPTLIGATGLNATLPAFTWSAVFGAAHYDVWVQDTHTGQVQQVHSVSGTTWTPPKPLTAGDTYKWWVRAIDGNGSPGPWSSPLSFLVGVTPQ